MERSEFLTLVNKKPITRDSVRLRSCIPAKQIEKSTFGPDMKNRLTDNFYRGIQDRFDSDGHMMDRVNQAEPNGNQNAELRQVYSLPLFTASIDDHGQSCGVLVIRGGKS